MYTKQNGKLVQVIPQPDLVVSMTYNEAILDLERAKSHRDIKIQELAGAEGWVATAEARVAKCVELGIEESKQNMVGLIE